MEKPNYADSKMYIYNLNLRFLYFRTLYEFIKNLIFRYEIMLDCWKLDPTLRPSFTDLAGRLGDLLQYSTRSVSA